MLLVSCNYVGLRDLKIFSDSPPYPWEIGYKTATGCLNPQIAPNTIYTPLFFLTYIPHKV